MITKGETLIKKIEVEFEIVKSSVVRCQTLLSMSVFLSKLQPQIFFIFVPLQPTNNGLPLNWEYSTGFKCWPHSSIISPLLATTYPITLTYPFCLSLIHSKRPAVQERLATIIAIESAKVPTALLQNQANYHVWPCCNVTADAALIFIQCTPLWTVSQQEQ